MTIIKKIIIIIMLILAAMLFYSYGPFNQSSQTPHDFIFKQNDKGLTMGDYNKKISRGDKLVLVYFNASWCMPCIKLKPDIEALEKEEAGICEVLKIDTDENPLIAEHFEINSLPMFILYKSGKKMWENTGFQTKVQLQDKLHTFSK